MILNSITEHIGNTPLLKIPAEVHGLKNISLYAKLEFLNPWGSVKDRTAMALLEPHLDELTTKTVIESSSGNSAKALQMIASLYGSQLRVMTNLIKDKEVKDILTIIGIDITELPGTSDCFDPTDPNDPVYYIQNEINKNPDGYIYTNQFINKNNQDVHYRTTGAEITADLEQVDHFIAGVGTAGSSLGISDRLKENNPKLSVMGVVAAKDDYLPGIRTYDELLQVGLFDPTKYTQIISITSSDALDAMMQLVRKTGLLVGPTTGASYAAALSHLKVIDETLSVPQTAVFIACDRLEWYTGYIRERKPEWFNKTAVTRWQDTTEASEQFDRSIEQVKAMIAKEKPLIVDLRQAISFKTAHIPNSINLPLEYFDKILNVTNPFCTEQTIIFVCPIGEKSRLVATYLQTRGVTTYNLAGGITAWRDAGGTLERDHTH